MATRRFCALASRMIEHLEPRVLLANQAIWIEGESPTSSTFNNVWLWQQPNLDASQLSPGVPGTTTTGAGLGHWGNAGSAQALYNFTVPEAGTYTFWARLQTHLFGSNIVYARKLDSGSFVNLDINDIASQQNLRSPNTGNTAGDFDGRVVGWVYGGTMNLTAGSHSITIRVSNTSGNLAGGIDALAFTNYPWAPAGPFRPNPSAPMPGASDWFAFGAGPDQFSSSSVIDLSYLNEDIAGSHGVLQRVGSGYQFADGTPVKFWGIDAGPTSTASTSSAWHTSMAFSTPPSAMPKATSSSIRRCSTATTVSSPR